MKLAFGIEAAYESTSIGFIELEYGYCTIVKRNVCLVIKYCQDQHLIIFLGVNRIKINYKSTWNHKKLVDFF